MKHTPNKDHTVPFVVNDPNAESNDFAKMLASGQIDEKYYQELVDELLSEPPGPSIDVFIDILETYGSETGRLIIRERIAQNIAVYTDFLVLGIKKSYNLK